VIEQIEMAGAVETPVLPDEKAENGPGTASERTVLSSPHVVRTVQLSQVSLDAVVAMLEEPLERPTGKETDAFLRVEIMWPCPPEAALPKCLLPPKKKTLRLPVTPEVFRPFCSLESTEMTIQNLQALTAASRAAHGRSEDS
jgi:hypothetical protein